MIYRKAVKTEWGRFVLEANDKGLTRVLFPTQAVSFADTEANSVLLDEAAVQFGNYISGQAYDFKSLSYDLSAIPAFQAKVLSALLKLPVKTISYSELAQLAGSPRASRAVGNAMNRNPFPVLIPCHRVIRADGDLGQYAWGQSWKIRFLQIEKILPLTAAAGVRNRCVSDIIPVFQ